MLRKFVCSVAVVAAVLAGMDVASAGLPIGRTSSKPPPPCANKACDFGSEDGFPCLPATGWMCTKGWHFTYKDGEEILFDPFCVNSVCPKS